MLLRSNIEFIFTPIYFYVIGIHFDELMQENIAMVK